MKINICLLILFFFLSNTSSVSIYGAADQGKNKRPNILFLLIDDQRNDTLGCAGHPILKTPVIDDLAKEGVRFTNAFVTTSICAASRASILTGLYERKHGYTFGKPPLSINHMMKSYPLLMRESGYRTGFIGKYGVRAKMKAQQLFDYFQPVDRKPYVKIGKNGSKRHETEIAGDKAIEFLKQQSAGQPFCLSISFNAVHADDGNKEMHYPWPASVDGMYEKVKIPEPRLADPNIFKNHPDFLKKSMNRLRYFWRWDTPEKYQRNMKAYFRMISGVDHTIGRIRKALRQLKLENNTVIIYIGDNGYYMGDRGFAGKWSHYEQSLRVPLIIHDPRLPPEKRGLTRNEMALNIDMPATMLDLAGIKIPSSYQGHSLVSFTRGKNQPGWRTDFFCEHLMNHKDIPKWEGVRGERYVYARYFNQSPAYEFLHDLKTDPDQLTNLVSKKDYGTILGEMRKRCQQLKNQYK